MLTIFPVLVFGLVFVKLSRNFFPENLRNTGPGQMRDGINSNFVFQLT